MQTTRGIFLITTNVLFLLPSGEPDNKLMNQQTISKLTEKVLYPVNALTVIK